MKDILTEQATKVFEKNAKKQWDGVRNDVIHSELSIESID
jgi:hypothetical protein